MAGPDLVLYPYQGSPTTLGKMFWFAFALVGALSQAGYNLAVKVLLRTVRPFPLAGFSFLSGSLVLFAVSFITGIPDTGPGLLPAVAVTVAINIGATVLFYRALVTTDLSLSVPMLAFTPVFLILTSFLILGELPSPAGAAGILLVATGAYLLNLEYRDGSPCSLTGPFLRLRRDRGIQAMLLVSFLYSISVNYDKRVVEESDPVFGSAIVLLLLGAAFLTLAALQGSGGVGVIPGSPARERQGTGRSEGEYPAGTDAHQPGCPPARGTGRSEEEYPAGTDAHQPGRPPARGTGRSEEEYPAGTDPHQPGRSPAQGSGRSEGECPAGTDPHQPGRSPAQGSGRSEGECPAGERHGTGGSLPGVPALLQDRPHLSSLVFPAIGLVLAIEVIAINTAYTMAIVPYVITVKRLAIFFSVLAGGLLLAERQLGGRITGAAVMIAGVAVIALWG
ncbi:MAG: EamA family transporter [Methanoregulaceae archaeon]|jgi:drug/metabolite transporter (DMT)-like permease